MEFPLFQTVIFTAFFLLLACSKWKKYQRERRISRYRNRENRRIDEGKILIAIQPIDIFVEISNYRRERFIQLQVEWSGFKKFVKYFKKFVGAGSIYYKVKDKKLNNIAFVQTLLLTKRVELFLYTSLQEEVADALLKKLDLRKYFALDRRRFCDGTSEELKHPTEIDSKIKRVIIITGSKHDHSEEDSEYFLVARKNELKTYGKTLTELITQNENVDELHHEFVHWKMDMESDFESPHDKTQ